MKATSTSKFIGQFYTAPPPLSNFFRYFICTFFKQPPSLFLFLQINF